jgi:tetratricopeptide (TPR) repeat protein
LTPDETRLVIEQLQAGDEARDQSRFDEARRFYRSALDALQSESAAAIEVAPESWVRLASICLQRLGDIERKCGQLDAANVAFLLKLEIDQKILGLTGESPEVLRGLNFSLQGLGDVEQTRGQFDAAQAHFQRAAENSQKILRVTGETPEALSDLSVSLGRLGDMELTRGQFDAAHDRFQQILKIAQKIVELTGETPGAQRGLGFCLQRLGDIERNRGQLDAAKARFELKLEIDQKILGLTGENPEALRDLGISLRCLGFVEQSRGQLEAAKARFLRMLEIFREILRLTGETPEALRDLSASLLYLGEVEQACGQLEAAHGRFQGTLVIFQQLLDLVGETPDTLLGMGISHVGLGDIELSRGQFDSAQARYEQALEIGRRILRSIGEVPQTLRILSHIFVRLGGLDAIRGDWSSATLRWLEQASLLSRQPTDLASWPGDAMRLSKCLVACTDADALSLAEAFAQRDVLWKGLSEFLNLNDPEALEYARDDIARFHALWLQLALARAPERIPEVLGAMQGRKIAALVLDEIEHLAASGSSSELHKRYLSLRFKLRQRALGLKVIEGGRSSSDLDLDDTRGRSRGGVGVSVSSEGVRQRLEDYRATLAQYQQARTELAQSSPELAALSPQAPQFACEALQQGLQGGEGLLLLVHSTPQGGQEQTPAQPGTHGLLITREHLELIPLPGLASVLDTLNPQGKGAVAHRSGTRDCIQAGQPVLKPDEVSSGALTTSSWTHKRASGLMSQFLWQPLGEALGDTLTQLSRLHVVTHGDLHVLPLTLGAPVLLSLYPGLVFYWQQRQSLAPQVQALRGLKLKVHSPEEGVQDLSPIPFVSAEAQLVAQSWGEVDEVLSRPAGQTIQALHLACHGMLQEGGEDASLIIAANERLGLQELLRSDLRAPIVYMSACLVGRTREDADGDPLGLVSAFFLRGARTVIAALTPIDDFFAPLLAHLFHRALHWQHQQGQVLDGAAALAQAKVQLRSGRWHPEHLQGEEARACEQEIADSLRKAYAVPLTNLLQAAVAGHEAEIWKDKLEVRVVQGLLDSAPDEEDFIPLKSDPLKPDTHLAWRLAQDLAEEQDQPGEGQLQHKAAHRLMNVIYEHRARLHCIGAVQNLIVAMQAYGDALACKH